MLHNLISHITSHDEGDEPSHSLRYSARSTCTCRTSRPKAAALIGRYLAEVHRAVLPAAAVAAVDTTLAVLAVEVSWSRMRRSQQTCRDGKMLVTETTSGRAFMLRILYDTF